jgi:hypothetical protein
MLLEREVAGMAVTLTSYPLTLDPNTDPYPLTLALILIHYLMTLRKKGCRYGCTRTLL